jgi:hypothetical protein
MVRALFGAVTLLAVFPSARGIAVTLTDANFKATMADKDAFVFFQAPW